MSSIRSSIDCRLCLFVTVIFITFIAIPDMVHAQVPASSHVVLVIDENHGFTAVQQNMPWLVNQGNLNGYANNYHSDNGGSLLDYLWLASGSCHSSANCTLPAGTNDFGCSGDSCASAITDDSIFREMNSLGISWKVYAQSYAAAGGTVTTPDNANGTSYYRRHNGATWYAEVLNNVSGSQTKIVDFSQFATDLANNALPQFSIIVPDGAHDAHDCPTGDAACLQAADDFLNTNLSPMLSKPYFQSGGDGLLFVTFDECGSGNNTDNNCAALVYTAVIGPKVIPGTVSNTSYKHENTLGTILSALGITATLGAASTNVAMMDFFNPSGGHVPNIDDQTNWTCTGNCSTSVGTTNQVDGASRKFQYTGGAAFTEGIWTAPLSGTSLTSATNFTVDFRSFITQPAVSQALEIHVNQEAGGFFYPFKVQCDFKGSGFWRVYDPPTDSWISTPVGCVVFTANSWDHFILHFHRSGTQLVYQDIVINNVTYSFNNITTNAIAQSDPDSVKMQVELIGSSSGSSYAWWIDQMSLSY